MGKHEHSRDEHVGEVGDLTSVPSTPLDAALGAAAGVATGSFTGAPGMIVGGILGAAIGAAVGMATKEQARARALANQALDKEIGISSGNVGAAPKNAPRARIGAFSSASAGAASITGGTAPDEGTMPRVD